MPITAQLRNVFGAGAPIWLLIPPPYGGPAPAWAPGAWRAVRRTKVSRAVPAIGRRISAGIAEAVYSCRSRVMQEAEKTSRPGASSLKLSIVF